MKFILVFSLMISSAFALEVKTKPEVKETIKETKELVNKGVEKTKEVSTKVVDKTKEVSSKVVDKTKEVSSKVVEKVKSSPKLVQKKLEGFVGVKEDPYTLKSNGWTVSAFPNILVNGVLVLPDDEGSSKSQETGMGLGMQLSFARKTIDRGVIKHINVLSTGFNIQDNGDVNFVLSPLSITFQNNINVGIGFMPTNNETSGGTTALHLGWDF